MIIGVIIFLVVVAILVGTLYTVTNRPEPKPIVQLIKLHGQYMANAARASRKGHVGESNVWMEGAKDLWKQLEQETATEPPPVRRIVARQLTEQFTDNRIPAHLLERARVARQKNS